MHVSKSHRAGVDVNVIVRASRMLAGCEPEGSTAPNMKGLRPRAGLKAQFSVYIYIQPVTLALSFYSQSQPSLPNLSAASTNTRAAIAPSLSRCSLETGEDQMSESG
jgi:hypothetical protein